MSGSTMKLSAKPDAIALMSAMTQARAIQTIATEASMPSTPVTRKPGARAGTCQIAGHFPTSTRKALKHLEAEEDRTLQELLEEALDDFLVKKGKAKLITW